MCAAQSYRIDRSTHSQVRKQNRQLEPDSMCLSSFNTTYNDNARVPPYQGIMFGVTSRTDITIQTFELDLRLDMASDLRVEIYTLKGDFLSHVSDKSAWTMVANTTAVMNPDGSGAIVPANEFQAVSIPAKTRRSFYISMNGPYLDHTVHALHKTGEHQARGDDLDVLVGSGMQTKFPKKPDPMLSPQFAGVIHYSKSNACEERFTNTSLDLEFLIEPTGEESASLSSKIGEVIGETLDYLVQTSMSGYNGRYEIEARVLQTTSQVYSNKCPDRWIECPRFFFKTGILVKHLDSMDKGAFLYDFYQETEQFRGSVASLIPASEVVYLGKFSMTLDFSMTLMGAPKNEIMDEIQISYFEGITKQFLNRIVADHYCLVLNITIDSQETNAFPGSDSSVNALEVKGKLSGAHPAPQTTRFYGHTLATGITEDMHHFIQTLKTSGLLPGPVSQSDRMSFFRNIASVSATFSLQVAPEASTSSSDMNWILISFIQLAAVFLLALGIVWWAKWWRRSISDQNEAVTARALRRTKEKSQRDLNRSQRSLKTEDTESIGFEASNSAALDVELGSPVSNTCSKSESKPKSIQPTKRAARPTVIRHGWKSKSDRSLQANKSINSWGSSSLSCVIDKKNAFEAKEHSKAPIDGDNPQLRGEKPKFPEKVASAFKGVSQPVSPTRSTHLLEEALYDTEGDMLFAVTEVFSKSAPELNYFHSHVRAPEKKTVQKDAFSRSESDLGYTRSPEQAMRSASRGRTSSHDAQRKHSNRRRSRRRTRHKHSQESEWSERQPKSESKVKHKKSHRKSRRSMEHRHSSSHNDLVESLSRSAPDLTTYKYYPNRSISSSRHSSRSLSMSESDLNYEAGTRTSSRHNSGRSRRRLSRCEAFSENAPELNYNSDGRNQSRRRNSSSDRPCRPSPVECSPRPLRRNRSLPIEKSSNEPRR